MFVCSSLSLLFICILSYLSPGAMSLCNTFGFLGSCTFGFLGSCAFSFLGSNLFIASTTKQVSNQFGERLLQTRHGRLLQLKHVRDFLQEQTKVAWFYYGYATYYKCLILYLLVLNFYIRPNMSCMYKHYAEHFVTQFAEEQEKFVLVYTTHTTQTFLP